MSVRSGGGFRFLAWPSLGSSEWQLAVGVPWAKLPGGFADSTPDLCHLSSQPVVLQPLVFAGGSRPSHGTMGASGPGLRCTARCAAAFSGDMQALKIGKTSRVIAGWKAGEDVPGVLLSDIEQLGAGI